MADLSTLFPQPSMDQLGPVAGMMMGDQFNIAKQNALLNQQGYQAAQQRQAEMHPLDMMFKSNQAQYQGVLARNTNAQADKNIYDLEQAKRLEEPTYKANLSKLLSSTSEDEVKQAHAELEKRLMSTDPRVRADAQNMYKTTGDMIKMYEQLRIQGQTARDVARIGADSRIAVAGQRASGGGGSKVPKSPRELMTFYDYKANTASTPEEAAHYQKLAQEQETLYLKEAILKAQAAAGGKVDVGAATGLATNQMPAPVATPRGQQPATPQPAAPTSQYEVGKTYPGKTGTYKYKGGDPSNKANWEKVN